MRAASVGSAGRGCPGKNEAHPKTSDQIGGADLDHRRLRTKPLRFANLLHGLLTFLFAESIDKQHTVKVVSLVLHTPCKKSTAFGDHRFTVHVEPLGNRPQGARCVIDQARQR